MELPGSSQIGGLWPAFWILGNLARHTYVGSSSNIWPWSKTSCDPGKEDAQKISGCLNTEHFGMSKGVGRGAPEIDIFEVQPGNVKHNVSVCKRPLNLTEKIMTCRIWPLNNPGRGGSSN